MYDHQQLFPSHQECGTLFGNRGIEIALLRPVVVRELSSSYSTSSTVLSIQATVFFRFLLSRVESRKEREREEEERQRMHNKNGCQFRLFFGLTEAGVVLQRRRMLLLQANYFSTGKSKVFEFSVSIFKSLA